MPRLRRALRDGAKRLVKDVTLGWLFPRAYRKAATKPVDPTLVIFLDARARTLPPSMTQLWNYLESTGSYKLEFISLGQGSVGLVRYERACLNAVRLLAQAAYIVLSDASDLVSCLPLRSQTRVLQLWHGCGAFKKWGRSVADLKFGNDAKALDRHPFYKNLDLVTVSSPQVRWAYEEAMMLGDSPQVVQPLGVSRTDVFFDKHFLSNARRRVEELVPAAVGKRIILYAPTFRGDSNHAKAPQALAIEELVPRFQDESVLLIKQHPFVRSRPAIPASAQEFAFDVSDTLEIDDLLACADVCISDYSSLVFEYSLFERPMIFFAPDKDDYADWRGFYYDYEEFVPGPIATTTKEVSDLLARYERGFNPQAVREFKERFMGSCDGHATERIWAALVAIHAG